MKNLNTRYNNHDAGEAETRMTRQNQGLQIIYDLTVADEQEDWEISQKIEDFNRTTSGQSSYFNEQIDQNGLCGLKLREEDIEDAKYIAECFGKEISLSDDALDIIYTALPGTTEINYATQTFPGVIFEDAFQCSATHELPFPPKVGEKEEAYWTRVLGQKNIRNARFSCR